MKNRYHTMMKLAVSSVLLVNLLALTSCKSKKSDSSSGQEESILETDDGVEVQIPEGEDTFGE